MARLTHIRAGLFAGVVSTTALFGVASLVAGCGDSASARAPITDAATFQVTKRDVRVTVTEKGTLKTANQVLVRPKIPGQAKILSLVDEGTQVAAGDVVCELDRTEIQREVQDLDNKVIALRGEVTAAEAELSIQLSENLSDVRDAALKHHFAQVELERWEKGEREQEMSKREIRVTEAQSELARAKDRFLQMPDLLKEGFVTKEQVEEERIRMVKAENELHLGVLDRDTYKTYTEPKDRDQRQADVRNAEQEVERAKQRAVAREGQRRSAVDRQKSELSNTEGRLKESRTTLENMTIRAPSAGIVLYGDARNPWDERQIKVGETVYAGQPFLTLPDLKDMLVVVAIHEADIARVKPGQKAYVNVESAREVQLEGKVARIAAVAAQQNMRWSDGVKRFNVEVAIEGDLANVKLKPGLSGKVEILLDELKGVLAVPQQAVFAQRGKFHVFRRVGDGAERAPVEIDQGNSQYVVIKSGLSDGDRILLYDPEAGGGAAVADDKAKGGEAPKDGSKEAYKAGANGGGKPAGAGGGERPKSKP
ncbi:MAG: efflux RND transporter periplasmic adaptor subunit [Planctomycetes bacterium]|nr:efflux RND transporter periplasmic adaptor subunit [Planctomycetota bacterium]